MKQPSIVDVFSKPKPASKMTSKKALPTDSSSSEGGAKAQATAKPKAVTKRKQVKSSDSESNSDSEDLMSRIRGKPTAAAKVGCFLTAPAGSLPRHNNSPFARFAESLVFLLLQKTKRWCDDDDDDFDADLLSLEKKGSSSTATVAPQDKPARRCKPVSYQVFNSDSEDEF